MYRKNFFTNFGERTVSLGIYSVFCKPLHFVSAFFNEGQ